MNIEALLSLFNLRDIEVEAYKTLLAGGLLSASEIARQMNVSRTSVYDLLSRQNTRLCLVMHRLSRRSL